MNLRKITFILLFLLCFLPLTRIHAETTNAGFVPSNIWYSQDPFQEGDKIKIYTLIFNPDSRELSGTVVFYDNTTLLGKKNFVVLGKEVKDISIDWTVNVGDHKIYATIENAKFLIGTGKYEDVTILENKSNESSRTVNKKIVPKATSTTSDTTVGQIQNIQNLITDNTPDFIAKPMVLGAETVEEFRSSTGDASKAKAVDLKKEIKVLNEQKSAQKSNGNMMMKPWKYVEYFFMTFVSFVFNNKIIFYPLLAILVFLLLRFIWRKIF